MPTPRNCERWRRIASRIPTTPRAISCLAYQYLVAGYSDAAAAQLKRVVALQPGDQVASTHAGGLGAAGRIATPAPAPPEQPAGLSTGPGRPDDRPGRQLAGRAQRRRIRSLDRREQPVHLEGRAQGQAAGHLDAERWPRPATRSSWRARTKARWLPRSSRAGPTSSSSLPPAARRTTKDSNSRGPCSVQLGGWTEVVQLSNKLNLLKARTIPC